MLKFIGFGILASSIMCIVGGHYGAALVCSFSAAVIGLIIATAGLFKRF